MDEKSELEARLALEADPAMVGMSRRFVANILAQWELDALADDAILMTSELVANAVLHARTASRLTLRSDGLSWLRIEVYDHDRRLPIATAAGEEDTSGRGLTLVNALGTRWGVAPRPAGKIVWVEMGLAQAAPAPGDLDMRGVQGVSNALDHIEQSRSGRSAGRRRAQQSG